MKILLSSLTLLTSAVLLLGAGGSGGVTYVPHDKVAAALSNGGSLVTAPDLLVSGSHRTGNGHVEVHEKETHLSPGGPHPSAESTGSISAALVFCSPMIFLRSRTC
jgi:hypothetical protein